MAKIFKNQQTQLSNGVIENYGSGTTGDLTAHAEGAHTTASGQYSHAEGTYTQALGVSSHTSGAYTIAYNDYETAIGKYNQSYNTDDKKTVFTIGGGTANDARSNIFEVLESGDVNISGDVIANGKTLGEANFSSVGSQTTDISNAISNISLSADGVLTYTYNNTINADTIDSYHIVVESGTHTGSAANTIYLVV